MNFKEISENNPYTEGKDFKFDIDISDITKKKLENTLVVRRKNKTDEDMIRLVSELLVARSTVGFDINAQDNFDAEIYVLSEYLLNSGLFES